MKKKSKVLFSTLAISAGLLFLASCGNTNVNPLTSTVDTTGTTDVTNADNTTTSTDEVDKKVTIEGVSFKKGALVATLSNNKELTLANVYGYTGALVQSDIKDNKVTIQLENNLSIECENPLDNGYKAIDKYYFEYKIGENHEKKCYLLDGNDTFLSHIECEDTIPYLYNEISYVNPNIQAKDYDYSNELKVGFVDDFNDFFYSNDFVEMAAIELGIYKTPIYSSLREYFVDISYDYLEENFDESEYSNNEKYAAFYAEAIKYGDTLKADILEYISDEFDDSSEMKFVEKYAHYITDYDGYEVQITKDSVDYLKNKYKELTTITENSTYENVLANYLDFINKDYADEVTLTEDVVAWLSEQVESYDRILKYAVNNYEAFDEDIYLESIEEADLEFKTLKDCYKIDTLCLKLVAKTNYKKIYPLAEEDGEKYAKMLDKELEYVLDELDKGIDFSSTRSKTPILVPIDFEEDEMDFEEEESSGVSLSYYGFSNHYYVYQAFHKFIRDTEYFETEKDIERFEDYLEKDDTSLVDLLLEDIEEYSSHGPIYIGDSMSYDDLIYYVKFAYCDYYGVLTDYIMDNYGSIVFDSEEIGMIELYDEEKELYIIFDYSHGKNEYAYWSFTSVRELDYSLIKIGENGNFEVVEESVLNKLNTITYSISEEEYDTNKYGNILVYNKTLGVYVIYFAECEIKDGIVNIEYHPASVIKSVDEDAYNVAVVENDKVTSIKVSIQYSIKDIYEVDTENSAYGLEELYNNELYVIITLAGNHFVFMPQYAEDDWVLTNFTDELPEEFIDYALENGYCAKGKFVDNKIVITECEILENISGNQDFDYSRDYYSKTQDTLYLNINGCYYVLVYKTNEFGPIMIDDMYVYTCVSSGSLPFGPSANAILDTKTGIITRILSISEKLTEKYMNVVLELPEGCSCKQIYVPVEKGYFALYELSEEDNKYHFWYISSSIDNSYCHAVADYEAGTVVLTDDLHSVFDAIMKEYDVTFDQEDMGILAVAIYDEDGDIFTHAIYMHDDEKYVFHSLSYEYDNDIVSLAEIKDGALVIVEPSQERILFSPHAYECKFLDSLLEANESLYAYINDSYYMLKYDEDKDTLTALKGEVEVEDISDVNCFELIDNVFVLSNYSSSFIQSRMYSLSEIDAQNGKFFENEDRPILLRYNECFFGLIYNKEAKKFVVDDSVLSESVFNQAALNDDLELSISYVEKSFVEDEFKSLKISGCNSRAIFEFYSYYVWFWKGEYDWIGSYGGASYCVVDFSYNSLNEAWELVEHRPNFECMIASAELVLDDSDNVLEFDEGCIFCEVEGETYLFAYNKVENSIVFYGCNDFYYDYSFEKKNTYDAQIVLDDGKAYITPLKRNYYSLWEETAFEIPTGKEYKYTLWSDEDTLGTVFAKITLTEKKTVTISIPNRGFCAEYVVLFTYSGDSITERAVLYYYDDVFSITEELEAGTYYLVLGSGDGRREIEKEYSVTVTIK